MGPNNRDGALFVTKNSSWHTFGDKQIELAHLLGPKIEWAHFLGQKNRDGAFFGKKSSWHTFWEKIIDSGRRLDFWCPNKCANSICLSHKVCRLDCFVSRRASSRFYGPKKCAHSILLSHKVRPLDFCVPKCIDPKCTFWDKNIELAHFAEKKTLERNRVGTLLWKFTSKN